MPLLTERLLLREFVKTDFDALREIDSDPEMQRYRSHTEVTAKQTREFLVQAEAQATEQPRQQYALAVVLRDGPRLIGQVGLTISNSKYDEAFLWYAILPSDWGKGYATEAAAEMLRYGFEQAGLRRVFAECEPSNVASVRVLEKIGLRAEPVVDGSRLRYGLSRQKLQVNYDEIAPHYDARYGVNALPGIAGLLRQVAAEAGGLNARGLEVGCGTGHWLGVLAPHMRHITGLDFSAGMLALARRQALASGLAQGQAGQLPFASASFDLLLCINALHHFPDPRAFIAESRRVLRPGGAWVNVGMDPHAGRDRWYLYDAFPGTLETDRQRFPSAGTLVDWVKAAGFERAAWLTPECISNTLAGRAVLDDPFLQKHGTSQLALLSEEAYEAGLARLRRSVERAEAAGQAIAFKVDLWMSAVVAWSGDAR